MITTTPLIPVMIAMNTYNQIERDKAKQREEYQRKEMERKQEIARQRHNETSCVQYEHGANYACCFYEPLPPETPASMVFTCNLF